MPIRLLLVTAIALAVLPHSASAACPSNTAWGLYTDDPNALHSSSPTWSGQVQCGSFSLDLVAGTMQLVGSGGGGEYTCGSGLEASDLYQIVGPASADPIPFEVRVHVSGNLTAGLESYPIIGVDCNTSSMRFTLSSGAASTVFADATPFSPCVGKPLGGDLALSLTAAPGVPFPVAYDLRSDTRGGVGTMLGAVTFAKLPAGYSVVSCQGYSAAPVPALPTSWGRLKQAYR